MCTWPHTDEHEAHSDEYGDDICSETKNLEADTQNRHQREVTIRGSNRRSKGSSFLEAETGVGE